MADARFPEKWLTDPTVAALSDEGFKVLALVGAHRAMTGVYDRMTVRELVDLSGGMSISVVGELIDAGVWTVDEGGLRFTASYIEDTRPFEEEVSRG